MAQGIAEEIFRLKADTDSIIKGLQQVKGVYKELTDEQVKQVAQLGILEQKEKELTALRNKSANPSLIIKYNKELAENSKQIKIIKDQTDALAAANHRTKVEIDAVSLATKNAFNGTQVNSVKNATTQFNSLGNSVNQISRELPAFAVSANVGFLAISNNLPIFFDALQKVKQENAALAAQGQKTTSVMAQLGGAIFSVGSLLSIGVTLLTVYGGEMIKWISTLYDGEKALESVTKANEAYNKSINQTKEDITDLTIQIKVRLGLLTKEEGALLKNENARTKALNASKELRKQSIDDLKKELNISQDLIDRYNKLQVAKKGGERLSQKDLLSITEIKNVELYVEELRKRNEANELNNQYINEEYNLRGKLIKLGDEESKKKDKTNTEKTVDLSDRIRQLQIDDIKVEQERERKQAEFDTERAIRDMKLLKATGEQKTALEIALNNDLVNKLEAIDKKYRDKQDDESRAQAKETGEAMNAVLEDNANTEIFLLEKKISKLKAQNKKANEDEIRALKVQVYEKKKILLDLQESEAIANLKQNEDGQINEAERFQIETEYANKRKKLEFDLLDSMTEKTKKSNKERMQDNVKYFADLLKALIDATKQMLAIKIKETDILISNQERRVEAAKGIADRGNAELLELEQKRLDDLNKKRENYVRQQQGLAALELIANTAVAVSKAASQTGVAAGVGIAAALIALIAGLASARSIASQAAYYEGGYTGDGNPRDESMAVGKRPYTYHKAEFVMDHKKTRQFRDIFEDIHGGKIDLKEWKHKVQMFDSMGGMAFNTSNPYTMNPQINNIIELKSLEGKLDNLNQSFRSLRLGLNVDEDGFTTFVSKRIERNNFIKNLAKP